MGDRPVTTAAEAGVLVKRAAGAAAAALRAEADRLRRAAHPGVVELLESSGDETGWELRLAPGGRPVDLGRRLPPAEVARVVAAAAATVADLHELGIVHGRIDASHVLLGAHGRVRLCGLGPGDPDAEPADDVAALGRLLTDLLGDGIEAEPIPDRRLQRGPRSAWLRRALLLLADQASAEPASRRPTARRLAASLEALVPEPRPGPRRPVGKGRMPARAALAATGAASVVVLAVLGMGGGSDRPTPPPACVADPRDGQGCADAVAVEGHLVVVDGVRFRVGEPGDEVVIGDWDCDGRSTPVLLRPATGEVFTFDGWADDRPLRAPALGTVSGAVRVRPPAGCGSVVVDLEGGEVVELEVEG